MHALRSKTLAFVAAVGLTSAMSMGTSAAASSPKSSESAISGVKLEVMMTAPAVTHLTKAGQITTITFTNGAVIALDVNNYAAWKKTTQAKAWFDRTGIRTRRPGGVTPLNTVVGNCGSATVTFKAIGNKHASIATGFHVDSPATDYHWEVNILDDFGVSSKTWGGVLGFRSDWAGGADFLGGGGKATAQVNVGSSYADTLARGFCFAGPAYSSTWIT